MGLFLKIENPGVAPVEAFTLIGASTKRNTDNKNIIGTFGSGNKNAVALALRKNLPPIIFAGNLKLEFVKKPHSFSGKDFERVAINFSGKDQNGNSKNYSEDLGYVVGYGENDWDDIALSLREFVSNAIDCSIEFGENEFLAGNPSGDIEQYRAESRDYLRVKVEVVTEDKVRAKAGFTRVFIPVDGSVLNFYENLGRWFLHFSEPELLNKTILKKNGRSFKANCAVIYKNGVRVREIEKDLESMFDYNLPNLELDEARKVDDYKSLYFASVELGITQDESCILKCLTSLLSDKKYLEFDFTYGLMSMENYGFSKIKRQTISSVWAKVFSEVYSNKYVISSNTSENEFIRHKGLNPIHVSTYWHNWLTALGLPTASSILTSDEKNNRKITEPTDNAIKLRDWAWSLLERHNLTNNKPQPPVKTFTSIMSGGSTVHGFYRDNEIFLNEEIVGDTDNAKITTLEEVTHYVTGSGDNSRDFQEFLLKLIVKQEKANV